MSTDDFPSEWLRFVLLPTTDKTKQWRQGIELIDARNRAHDEHLAFMERRRMEE